MLAPYDFSMSIAPLLVALIFIFLIIALRVIKKGPRSMRICLYILFFLGTVEFAVFRNPVCLKFFWKHLSAEQTGRKQRSCLRLDYASSQDSWKKPYLAVGSSQTQAVFAPASKEYEDLDVIHSSGMTPVEIWWYRELIKKHCNGTILLYLSELDLTRGFETNSFKLSPQAKVSDLLTLSEMLRDETDAHPSELAELWICNFVATYRYQFLAEGFLKKVTEKIGGTESTTDPEAITWDNDAVKILISRMKNRGDQWISVNLRAIDSFLLWASENDLKVVITPGAYHPLAERHFDSMRTSVASSLKNFCSKYPNTHYIEDDFFGAYEVEDFKDPTHVTPDTGKRFTKALLTLLNKSNLDRPIQNRVQLEN